MKRFVSTNRHQRFSLPNLFKFSFRIDLSISYWLSSNYILPAVNYSVTSIVYMLYVMLYCISTVQLNIYCTVEEKYSTKPFSGWFWSGSGERIPPTNVTAPGWSENPWSDTGSSWSDTGSRWSVTGSSWSDTDIT
jgi:hypothetical protein